MLLIKTLKFNKKVPKIKNDYKICLKSFKITKIKLFNFIKTILNNIMELDNLNLNSLLNLLKLLDVRTNLGSKNYLKIFQIIKVNLKKSNYFINLTDYKGNTLLYYNSGLLNYVGSQKTTKQSLSAILLKTYKKIKTNYKQNHYDNISIHFIENDKNLNKNVVKRLEQLLNIRKINFYSLAPHNGCRPKKLKRLKKFNFKFF